MTRALVYQGGEAPPPIVSAVWQCRRLVQASEAACAASSWSHRATAVYLHRLRHPSHFAAQTVGAACGGDGRRPFLIAISHTCFPESRNQASAAVLAESKIEIVRALTKRLALAATR